MKETKLDLILKVSTKVKGDRLITPEEFSISTEHRAIDEGLTLLESIQEGLRIINFDGEFKDAAKLITKPLRERLAYEIGIGNNKKTQGKLPI